MAITTGLPPQAYTRDTLVKAIEWLNAQPASVRERAISADAIVSFYLQARRRNPTSADNPVSGEAFKADLKALAEGLKQFEDTVVAPPTPQKSSPSPVTPTPVTPTPTASAPTGAWLVDPRSLAAAREIQDRLNLGTEMEALRMLVTLGVERARELFPTGP